MSTEQAQWAGWHLYFLMLRWWLRGHVPLCARSSHAQFCCSPRHACGPNLPQSQTPPRPSHQPSPCPPAAFNIQIFGLLLTLLAHKRHKKTWSLDYVVWNPIVDSLPTTLLLPDAIVEGDIDLCNPVSLIPSVILAERDLFKIWPAAKSHRVLVVECLLKWESVGWHMTQWLMDSQFLNFDDPKSSFISQISPTL
jgi:hypothetical protein